MRVPTTGEFNILIEMPSETEQNNTPDPSQPKQENAPISKNPASGGKDNSVKTAAIANVVISTGKQALNAAVSNIGLATGNSYKQQQVQKTLSVAGSAIAFAGMLATGNYLAAVAMAASSAISYASENYQIEKNREITNYVSAQNARKLGYTNARR